MKKLIKKMSVVAMATIMTLSFAACGAKNSEVEAAPETSVSVEASVEDATVSYELTAEAVASLLAEYGVENETYVNYVVGNVTWTEVASDETADTDFVKVVVSDDKTTVYHAMVADKVDLGEIHTTKANKSNDFFKLTLNGCKSESTAEGSISYDFSYNVVTNGVDLAELAKALEVTE